MTILLWGIILTLFSYSVFATAALSQTKSLYEASHRAVGKQHVMIKDKTESFDNLFKDYRILQEELKSEREIKNQFVALHRDYMQQRHLNKQLSNQLKNERKIAPESSSFREGSD